jgi:hypothetical protein
MARSISAAAKGFAIPQLVDTRGAQRSCVARQLPLKRWRSEGNDPGGPGLSIWVPGCKRCTGRSWFAPAVGYSVPATKVAERIPGGFSGRFSAVGISSYARCVA